jgi:hypothetical protein
MPLNQRPADDALQHCRCGKSFFWGTIAASGKRVPLNPRRLVTISDDGEFQSGYETHFSDCSYAKQFSRDRKAGLR